MNTWFEYRGLLRKTPVRTVLYKLHARALTGTLRVVVAGLETTVLIVEGAPAWAETPSQEHAVGATLVRMGRLSVATVMKALDAQEPGERLGERLIAMGAVDRSAVDSALKAQAKERVLSLFGAREGEYHFREGRTWGPGQRLFPQSGIRLLAEGLRRTVTDNELATQMGERLDWIVQPTSRLPEFWRDIREVEDCRELQPFLSGDHTVSEIVAAAALHPLRVLRALSVLEGTRCIRVTEPRISLRQAAQAGGTVPDVVPSTGEWVPQEPSPTMEVQTRGVHAEIDAVKALLRQGAYRQAYRKACDAISLFPDNANLAALRVWIVFQLPHRDAARQARVCANQLSLLVDVDPTPDALYFLAMIRRSQGQHEVCAGLLEACLQQQPDHPEALEAVRAAQAAPSGPAAAPVKLGSIWSRLFNKDETR